MVCKYIQVCDYNICTLKQILVCLYLLMAMLPLNWEGDTCQQKGHKVSYSITGHNHIASNFMNTHHFHCLTKPNEFFTYLKVTIVYRYFFFSDLIS